MKLITKKLSRKKYLLALAAAVIVVSGAGITKALLGGTSSPVSSSDIELQRGLVGWWKLDGNATDSTPYANNGTLTGATSVADREGASASALSFAGSTTSYAQMSPINNFPSTAITVSFWVKTTDADSGLFSYATTGTSGDNMFLLYANPGVHLYRASVNSNTGINIDDGNWHLVTMTWQSSGGTYNLYVDGALAHTSTLASGTTITNGGCLMLAQEQDSVCGGLDATQAMNGSMDDVRVYNRVLSAAEVSTLYQEYNPGLGLDSGQSGLVALWKFNGSAKDSTPYDNDGTVNGATPATDREGTANSAYSFDGSTNYIQVNSSQLDSVYNTGEVSFSVWFYYNSADPAGALLRHGESSSGNGHSGCTYEPNIATQGVALSGCSGTGTIVNYSLTTGWNHIVVTFDNAHSSDKVYLNGSLVGTGTQHTASLSAPLWMIGAAWNVYNSSIATYFTGKIDEIRVYNRPITQTEVTKLYNSYESQISLYQSSPGGSVNLGAGLVGEWDLNGNAKDATPYADDGTVSSATLTTDREGRANSAYSFNGTSQYITIPYSSTIKPTSAVTVSAWIKPTNLGTEQKVVSTTEVGGYDLFVTGSTSDVCSANNIGFIVYVGGAYRKACASIGLLSNNTWAHLVGTYDGTTVQLYLNGSLVGTPTSTSGSITYSHNNALCIGDEVGTSSCNGGQYFAGLIDDARLWNRALSQAEVTALYSQYR